MGVAPAPGPPSRKILGQGAAARGAPVQVNVVGTLMFVLALAAVGAGQLLRRRGRRS